MSARTASRARDDYERMMAAERPGLYESHYLKANSADGGEAFWIKHNLLVPPEGGGIGEFWLIWFRRGEAPMVYKREVPMGELVLEGGRLGLRGDGFRLDAGGCEGRIADAAWRLTFSGGMPPLFHFAARRMYAARLPKKKILTPAPNLGFDGEVTLGGRKIDVAGWVGLRGHNWGTEHAHAYAYGSCNRWDDGARGRAIDGFTARVRIGPVLSPWLSTLVYRDGELAIEKNGLRHWINRRAVVEPTVWRLPYQGLGLVMEGEHEAYAGLRYRHPDGRESYCYNTKFARVTVEAGGGRFTSESGEHEVLFPEPLPAIPLHPAAGWTQADGDYRSAPR